MRTSMWSASSSAGGRVCGVILSSSSAAAPSSARRGRRPSPTASSRSSPARSCPARRRAPCGWLMPNGPKRKNPACAVEQAAEHARRVEARNAEPVDRPVGRDQRARVAVREERVVRDRRERRGRGGALRRRGAVAVVRRSCRDPGSVPAAVAGDEPSAAAGPHEPGAYGVDRRRGVEQRLHDPPRLLDAVLAREARAVADHRRVQQHLVRRRRLRRPPRRTPCRAGSVRRPSARCASSSSRIPVDGSSLTTSWFGSASRSNARSRGAADA